MTLEELYRGINEKLGKIKDYPHFKQVTVENEDNDDEIKRPSVRVIVADYAVEKVNRHGVKHAASPEIYYYSKNEAFSNEENVEMEQVLENLFLKGIQIKGALIEPARIGFQKEPGILCCKLENMEHTVYTVEEEGEEIEELFLALKGEQE